MGMSIIVPRFFWSIDTVDEGMKAKLLGAKTSVDRLAYTHQGLFSSGCSLGGIDDTYYIRSILKISIAAK